jgi:hypothetical protein
VFKRVNSSKADADDATLAAAIQPAVAASSAAAIRAFPVAALF